MIPGFGCGETTRVQTREEDRWPYIYQAPESFFRWKGYPDNIIALNYKSPSYWKSDLPCNEIGWRIYEEWLVRALEENKECPGLRVPEFPDEAERAMRRRDKREVEKEHRRRLKEDKEYAELMNF